MKRLKYLNDLIELLGNINNSETSEMGFDMERYAATANLSCHPCGSACCIGGWVQYTNGLSVRVTLALMTLDENMTFQEAEDICYPPLAEECTGFDGWSAEPRHAIKLLKHYQKTGEVDWAYAMDDTE